MMGSAVHPERIGREFLLWLWYQSETKQGVFRLPGGKSVEIWPGGRAVLEASEGRSGSDLVWRGDTIGSEELRRALDSGRHIRRAEFVLHMDHHEWTLVLDSETLDVRSLRIPKPEREEGDDPVALGLERLTLMEAALETVDTLFGLFLGRRYSEEWARAEGAGLSAWVSGARF